MNSDFPTNPREALEASLTAMLLGELPPDQVAFLERLLAEDAELRATYEQLKETIVFVREAEAEPKVQQPLPQEPLKLSAERREQLLAHFKTVPLEQPKLEKRRSFSPVLVVAAVLVGMLFLGSMFLSALAPAKSKGFRTWSLADRGSSGAAVQPASQVDQLDEKLLRERRREPANSPVTDMELGVPLAQSERAPIVLPAEPDGLDTITVNGFSANVPARKVREPELLTMAPSEPSVNVPGQTPPVLQKNDYNNFSFYRDLNASGGAITAGKPAQQEAQTAGGRADNSKSVMLRSRLAGLDSKPQSGESVELSDRETHNRAYISPPQPSAAEGLQAPAATPASPQGFFPGTTPAQQTAPAELPTIHAAQVPILGDTPLVGLPFRGEPKAPEMAANIEKAPKDVIVLGDPAFTGLLGFGESEKKQGKADTLSKESLGVAREDQTVTFGLMQPQMAANDKVEDGRRLYEKGQNTEAKRVLQEVIRDNPQDQKAYDYLNQLNEQEHKRTEGKREEDTRERLVKIEKYWAKPAAGAGAASAGRTSGPPVYSANIVGYVTNGFAAGSRLQENSSGSEQQQLASVQRELEELKTQRRALYTKIETESTDLKLPKTSLVEITDLASAQPGEEERLGAKLRSAFGGGFEKKARVKAERDQTDISGLQQLVPNSGTYNPYFIQTENEVIRSDEVLGRVVDKLRLAKKESRSDAIRKLRGKLDLSNKANSSLIDIGVKSDTPQEAADFANAVAKSYKEFRVEEREKLASGGIKALGERLSEVNQQISAAQETALSLSRQAGAAEPPVTAKPSPQAPIPQPEIDSRENAFSTFSLNVSDVSFKLAAASLEKGALPDAASIRSEEFVNAFDYRDPEPSAGMPVGFAYDRARYPFAQSRDLLRFSIKTAAQGRQAGRPLNLVILLDNSGSMERADRVQIIKEALHVLAGQLQAQDKISLVTFARTAQLRFDGVPGNQATNVADEASGLTPQGGTNLEEAMNVAYATARKHYLADGINRVVLLTDGAANLGDVEPENLKKKVEEHRKQGIALDCFGIGWEGLNDDLLEVLSRNGDGRYGFINTPEEAATGFAAQLAGALHVAASDVKVQVEFNPKRVSAWRQIGYAKHQLTKEQFRDNTVDAAELGAAESGNALYVVNVIPSGEGPLATVRVRYKVPGTTDYHEHEWSVAYNGSSATLEQAAPAIRLAAVASALSEWLATNPYATEVTTDGLLNYLRGIPETYGPDPRPQKLEWMIRQAKSLSGK